MARKRVTRKQFAKIAGDGASVAVALRKHFAAEIKLVGEAPDLRAGGVLDFKISSGIVDRERDTIAVEGWELANFGKSGTVLANHDTSQPIARPFETRIDDDALRSKAEFPDSDTHEFGNLQFRLLNAGILRGTSVGFQPLEWAFSKERDDGSTFFPPIDFTRQELLEFSVVSVPANPDALLEARSKGFDLGPMRRWAEQMMDESPEGLSVTREQLESIRKKLAPTSVAGTKQEDDDGTEVQTLIFSKDTFTQEEAVEWADSNDFKSDKVDETEDSFRLRQKDPDEFDEDSLKSVELADGVTAVVGIPMSAADTDDDGDDDDDAGIDGETTDERQPSDGGLVDILSSLASVVAELSQATDDNGETLNDENAERMAEAAALIEATLESVKSGQKQEDDDEPDDVDDDDTDDDDDDDEEVAALVERAMAEAENTPDAIVQRALASDAGELERDLRRMRGALP